ncbi:MAG: hypothetical protein BWK76_20260 [Desulfobulbaceae bacterium A2]|nr:MAG: hypothetical protein BWK76_20260 [Desulfobulbaceae bacterium A2]
MGMFTYLGLGPTAINWEMTPDYTFGTFESWGGVERVRSRKERTHYFFIDAWNEVPRLCLMERGIKHARVLAEVLAPREMLDRCVADQGKAVFEKSYAIDETLRQWLIANVIDDDSGKLLRPLVADDDALAPPTLLPLRSEAAAPERQLVLSPGPEELDEEAVRRCIASTNFFEAERHPNGLFQGTLVDNGDGLTVTDLTTGLMWQREGIDIMSLRQVRRVIERCNAEGLAGYSDWRLPGLAEALSLLTPHQNMHGQFVHPCFSPDYPFVFVNATRSPGGNWYVDYKQARVFWSSPTIPGGFARLVRNQKAEDK